MNFLVQGEIGFEGGFSLSADSCSDEGTITQENDHTVTTCVDGSQTNVCYPDGYHHTRSIAEAACDSQGLVVHCK